MWCCIPFHFNDMMLAWSDYCLFNLKNSYILSFKNMIRNISLSCKFSSLSFVFFTFWMCFQPFWKFDIYIWTRDWLRISNSKSGFWLAERFGKDLRNLFKLKIGVGCIWKVFFHPFNAYIIVSSPPGITGAMVFVSSARQGRQLLNFKS